MQIAREPSSGTRAGGFFDAIQTHLDEFTFTLFIERKLMHPSIAVAASFMTTRFYVGRNFWRALERYRYLIAAE